MRMAVKKCSVQKCMSCSTRKEDIGVTYHKYPKDGSLREAWARVTRIKRSNIDLTTFVCSRHFRKSDFQIYKDSKYVLKSDSIPSIFPWVTMDTDIDSEKTDEKETKMETDVFNTEDTALEINFDDDNKEEVKALNNSKESDGENVDAIRKYIEEQEKELQQLSSSKELRSPKASDKKEEEVKAKEEVVEIQQCKEETMAVAASVMDMILSESEARIAKKDDNVQPKHVMSSNEKGNSMALSVGSQVEAKDFAEFWHPAEIVEVDYDEMEVLVRYENPAKRHDEWISVSSPRLRPRTRIPPGGTPHIPPEAETIPEKPAPVLEEVKEEPRFEDKPKQTFSVGERCLARWRDNRRFIATITKDLGEGSYEIAFDDGFQWKCTTSRLYKYKDNLSIDTSSTTPSNSVPSPIQHGAGPSSAPLPPAYHTHLFDPNRDYLGSKSERREMKRKLNIKEIFNIGQKKKKKIPEEKTPVEKQQKVSTEKPPKVLTEKPPKVPTEKPPKVPTEKPPKVPTEKPPKVATPKKPKAVKKKMTLAPPAETKTLKTEVPDAVASIIGTIKEDVVEPEKKEQLEPEAAIPTASETVTDIENNDAKVKEEDIVDKEDVATPSAIPEPEKGDEGITTNVQNEASIVKMDVDNEIPIFENETTLVENVTAVESSNIDEQVVDASNTDNIALDVEGVSEMIKTEQSDVCKTENDNKSPSLIPKEEVKLEKFENHAVKHEEVIDKIKEVITKIEDDLNKVDAESPKVEIKEEIKTEGDMKEKKKLSKVKKGKKLRLLQEKKVKKQVEKVKNELEVMKRQVEEMRKQMLLKTGEIEGEGPMQMPDSFLLPGEWCCKWMNGQPVGKVCELETEVRDGTKVGLPRRSVQVEDKRLPEGWTKHMVRRSLGNSAGKWDVVLVSPDNRRFHTKTDMRNYLENNPNSEALKPFEHALMDFGVHLKLSRRMGWFINTPGGADDIPVHTLPAGTLSSTSPLVKRRKLSLNNRARPIKIKMKQKKRKMARTKMPGGSFLHGAFDVAGTASSEGDYMVVDTSEPMPPAEPPIEDGYVWVGSLKVQIIDNLLRCPAEGCFKNFRNNTLIQMHIKHYHRDLRKMLGRTPKVADLAYARTMPTDAEMLKPREPEMKSIKVKIARLPKKEEPKPEIKLESQIETPTTPIKEMEIPKQDSPKLRSALINKPVKRPKVLLPVRRPKPEVEQLEEIQVDEPISEPIQLIDVQDFEASISTHTVTKPIGFERNKDRRGLSEDDEWYAANSDMETQSSFPRSGTPDSKSMDQKPVSSESNEEQQKENNMYTYTENGERIKIVHMKREEIINCHCGFREEDGLMVQCELCLCWQHALCHNIQRESEVPEKYTCSICLNPRRGRRSKRFLHDQDRLYEGLLPGARPCESLRRSHELSGNLLRIQDALHALTVKYHVATKKDHPKLYLWAKDWENGDINLTQERLNVDYSDLNIMLNTIGKENLPVKVDELGNHSVDEEHDRLSQPGGLGPVLLTGLLSSPESRALELPISTSEIERLARSVQEQELPRAPQPEAAIENGPCRERLLRHIQRCQALIDARLDSIEAQVAELESQDPSFEDDETADYFPRTKQTIQMLMRDLDTMEELGAS